MISFRTFLLLVCAACACLATTPARAARLGADTVWQGEVKLSEDLLVPEGVTLVVRAGTTVRVAAAESTKTDPEYLSPLTEITVRGTLRIEGTKAAPVLFTGRQGNSGVVWAGVLIDGGSARVAGCRIRQADAAFALYAGSLSLEGSLLERNRYGLVLSGPGSRASLGDSRITSNDYGVVLSPGAQLEYGRARIDGNRKKDRHQVAATAPAVEPEALPEPGNEPPVGRSYKDAVLRGDTVWQGRVQVDGVLRVPEGSRLVILPGTLVEFRRRLDPAAGVGLNGLMIQGVLIAKGSPEKPIVFRSAEATRRMADWDAINIMNSAGTQNLIEYCRIEDAYRGLHFHFSKVTVQNSALTHNYRGIQFQESQVEISGSTLSGNKSGIQGRDSDLAFRNNTVRGNATGANFFRATLQVTGNRFTGNRGEGLRVREGVLTLRQNQFDGNRFGVMVADSYFGEVSGNVLSGNVESGLALKNVDNLEVAGNYFSGNALNGLQLQEARASVHDNQFSDNGERGVGVVSFAGVLTRNNFAHNGLYAVDLEGTADVAAPENWWGGDEPAKAIMDRKKDPSRGSVEATAPGAEPVPFLWPVDTVVADLAWRGSLSIPRTVTVSPGVALSVAPKSRVAFGPGSGLLVQGKLVARGERDAEIVFTSTGGKRASEWDEIRLEYAVGSEISHCVFEYATWGIHSHFTPLTVSETRFAHNYGGMRFRSGPVRIRRSTFRENGIGIRSYLGNALITENSISGNETGIFVREKGGGLEITRNDIFGNSSYGIRLGDFNTEDVKARENWWGTSPADQAIYDARQEPGVGMVLYRPELKEPVLPADKEKR